MDWNSTPDKFSLQRHSTGVADASPSNIEQAIIGAGGNSVPLLHARTAQATVLPPVPHHLASPVHLSGTPSSSIGRLNLGAGAVALALVLEWEYAVVSLNCLAFCKKLTDDHLRFYLMKKCICLTHWTSFFTILPKIPHNIVITIHLSGTPGSSIHRLCCSAGGVGLALEFEWEYAILSSN